MHEPGIVAQQEVHSLQKGHGLPNRRDAGEVLARGGRRLQAIFLVPGAAEDKGLAVKGLFQEERGPTEPLRKPLLRIAVGGAWSASDSGALGGAELRKGPLPLFVAEVECDPGRGGLFEAVSGDQVQVVLDEGLPCGKIRFDGSME